MKVTGTISKDDTGVQRINLDVENEVKTVLRGEDVRALSDRAEQRAEARPDERSSKIEIYRAAAVILAGSGVMNKTTLPDHAESLIDRAAEYAVKLAVSVKQHLEKT